MAAPYDTGLLLCNPPYGERMGDEVQAAALYKNMAALNTRFGGWDIGVITAHKSFQECFGRYADLLKSIKAGNLNTTLYIYSEKMKSGAAQAGAKNTHQGENGGRCH